MTFLVKLLLGTEEHEGELVDAACRIFMRSRGGPGAIMNIEALFRLVRDFQIFYRHTNDEK